MGIFSNPSWNFILHLATTGLQVDKSGKSARKTTHNSSTTESTIIADTMEVVLQPRRRVGRQVHRDNPNVNSVEQLWRTTMSFAFLDHVNNELERTFPGDQRHITICLLKIKLLKVSKMTEHTEQPRLQL
jgi:hypothetical protein